MQSERRVIRSLVLWFGLAFIFSWIFGADFSRQARAQADDPSPPGSPVKLVFIHHSTGENWLADGYGDLGGALQDNNYFVSDTNYGWGPEAIGDRTDILNWPEWFRSPETPRIMQALFNESGQNSAYSRSLADPGGENQVVLFKSCFPNSELHGNPDDPPVPGDELSVGSAKFIYNDLLNYFQTRPDRLFVVITAPPLIDSTFADNARAFNTWLVRDWLRENSYNLGNVAVFDFYNVLTHPDNHHRFVDGAIEYVNNRGGNTEYYPSGDDHPNEEGSRKATDEFLPLLNVFYHRWQAGAPGQPPEQQPPAEEPTLTVGETPVDFPPAASPSSTLIDDFEAESPPEREGWTGYWEDGAQTTLECQREGGMAKSGQIALHINYNVPANSWGTCAMFYRNLQDWRSAPGMALDVHALQPGQLFNINVYEGAQENRASYIHQVEITPPMAEGWVHLEVPWDLLHRVEWEADPGSALVPDQVSGMAIGFNTFPDTPNAGEMWVDDIMLMGSAIEAGSASQLPAEPAVPTAPGETAVIPGGDQDQTEGGAGLCPFAPVLGMLAGGLALLTHLRRR